MDAGNLSMMSAGDAQPVQHNSVFTSYVAPQFQNMLLKTEASQIHYPDLASLDALMKSSKLKRIVRSTDWPVGHEVRRGLWIKLCNFSFDCRVVPDELAYKESVKDLFGEGETTFDTVQWLSF
jgi:hypothetical protein